MAYSYPVALRVKGYFVGNVGNSKTQNTLAMGSITHRGRVCNAHFGISGRTNVLPQLLLVACGLPGSGKQRLGKSFSDAFSGNVAIYDSGEEMRKRKLVHGPGLVSDNNEVFAPFRERFMYVGAPESAVPIVYGDGILREPSQVGLLVEMLELGKNVAVVFLDVDARIANQRMVERATQDPARSVELSAGYRENRIKVYFENVIKIQQALNDARWLASSKPGIPYTKIDASLPPEDVAGNTVSWMHSIFPDYFHVGVNIRRRPMTDSEKAAVTVPSFEAQSFGSHIPALA